MSDTERMLDLATAALHEWDPTVLWPVVTEELLRGHEGDLLIHKTEEWTENAGAVIPWTRNGMSATCLEERAERLIRRGDPFISNRVSATDWTPVTASRLVGERTWRDSATARLVRSTFALEHVLGLPFPGDDGAVHGCLVYRSGADFTDTHLAYARQVQPLLSGIHRQVRLLRLWSAAAGEAGAEREAAASYRLTPRETTVLTLLAEALTAKAMARSLGVSVRTVHKHVENLYRKLGTRDRVATVMRAQQEGLLPYPGDASRQGLRLPEKSVRSGCPRAGRSPG